MHSATTDELPPLIGFKVGITADRRWEEQAELLTQRGATVLHGPTIKTLPVGSGEDLAAATTAVRQRPADVLIANTGIGIRAWFAAAESWGVSDDLLRALQGCRIYARGPKASAALHLHGLEVHGRASSEQLDELVSRVIGDGVVGRVVAVQLHGDDSPDMLAALADAGAIVVPIPVYRWILPPDLGPAQRLVAAAVHGSLHAVTFTSAPAARNTFRIAETIGLEGRLRDAINGGSVLAIAVGPVCAGALVEIGIPMPIVPPSHRLGAMIRTLTEWLPRGASTPATIGGEPIQLMGRVAHFADRRVELSIREAAVLDTLLAAAPRVVSRTDLLAAVWDAKTDPHVCEVTIARLRKRLGDAAGAIVSVPRRGYVLKR